MQCSKLCPFYVCLFDEVIEIRRGDEFSSVLECGQVVGEMVRFDSIVALCGCGTERHRTLTHRTQS